MAVFTSSPQVRVNFFTERGNVSLSQRFVDTRDRDQIISVTTNKALGQPCGSFTIVMTAQKFKGEPQVRRRIGPSTDTAALEAEARRGTGWTDLLRPGDLVVIEMGPDRPQPAGTYYEKNFTRDLQGATEIVMIGSIDDVRESMSIGADGKPSRIVTVNGRDFGKYLVDDSIWDSVWWSGISQLTVFRAGLAGLDGLPARIIQYVVQRWLFEKYDVEFKLTAKGTVLEPGVRKLSEILRLALDSNTPLIPYPQNWMGQETNLWSYFREIQGPPFYNLVIDTRRRNDVEAMLSYAPTTFSPPNVPRRIDTSQDRDRPSGTAAPVVWNTLSSKFDSQVALMFMRCPFSNRDYDDFTALPTRVITPDDVVSEDVGISLEEVFTRWRVLPQALGFNRPAFNSAIDLLIDPELERQFGFRPRILRVPFFYQTGDATLFNLANTLQRRLRDWDRFNLDMMAGRYVVKGMAAARVGDRLHYDTQDGSSGVDYYLEGVTQDFQQFVGWRTTLTVTRGQIHRNVGERLFDDGGNPLFSPRAFQRIG